MDLSHFFEIPLATWAMAAVSVVILGVVFSAKYVFIALLAGFPATKESVVRSLLISTIALGKSFVVAPVVLRLSLWIVLRHQTGSAPGLVQNSPMPFGVQRSDYGRIPAFWL